MFFLSSFPRNFDDQLSPNFHRLVILWLWWDTPSEKTGLWQLPNVYLPFNEGIYLNLCSNGGTGRSWGCPSHFIAGMFTFSIWLQNSSWSSSRSKQHIHSYLFKHVLLPLVVQFLEAVMEEDYENAEKLCKMGKLVESKRIFFSSILDMMILWKVQKCTHHSPTCASV